MSKKKSKKSDVQNVSYRNCDPEFLALLVSLPKASGNMLLAILDEVDILDNCLQVDIKTLEPDRKVRSKVLKPLKDNDVIRDVVDIHGVKRTMVNPALVWSTGRDKLRFAINMYKLGSHDAGVKHTRFEQSLVAHVDPDTGEISGNYQDREEELIRALADAISGNVREAA